MKSLALLSLFAIIFLSSCNKYSEGPNFSLLTRKARITNDWVLESYTKDGTDLYDASYEMNLSIEKDGTFSTRRPQCGQSKFLGLEIPSQAFPTLSEQLKPVMV